MELIDLLRIMRRWLWMIVAIVLVMQLALWLGVRSTEPVYAATVKLQISIPQREDVSAYDQARSINPRDEITAAINNFTELLQSDDVHARTVAQLGLDEKDSGYTVNAKRVSDADFINVNVEARTPDLAAEIANVHVNIATAYYGELRAQSTKAEMELFAEQLRLAEKELQTAEKALADFRTQNGIYSLDDQITTEQELLARLQWERDQRLLDQAAIVNTTTGNTIPVTTTSATPAIDPVAEVNKLIAQRQTELDQFTALAPQYNILAQNADQARAAYKHLLGKYNEAQLKVTAVRAANFIQVVKPAYAPIESESSWLKLAVLAFVGSLGLGVVLAFLLQYLFGFKGVSVTTPGSDQKAPSYERSDVMPSTGPDAEQEPIAVQVQHGSTETEAG